MWQNVTTFLDSNFFVALVGFLAIYLYFKQKKDKKRDAARLILQEIRYAEQQIRNYRATTPPQYSLASRLLPTNSWNDNIHLFIKDLKETEIDMISAFYSKATYIDSLIVERSKQKINPPPVQSVPINPPLPVSVTAQPHLPGGGNPQQVTPPQVSLVISPTLEELITNQLLADVSSSVKFLYNTPAAEKLRKISEQKWYQPI